MEVTEHDIEMQQRHEDAQVYASEKAERLAADTRSAVADMAYADLLDSLSQPEGCGLIAEAIEQSDRAAELGALIASKTATPTLAGVLLWNIVTDYLRKLAEREE